MLTENVSCNFEGFSKISNELLLFKHFKEIKLLPKKYFFYEITLITELKFKIVSMGMQL